MTPTFLKGRLFIRDSQDNDFSHIMWFGVTGNLKEETFLSNGGMKTVNKWRWV